MSPPARPLPDYATFVRSWSTDSFPFCPVGLPLLYRLAQARPDLYEHARQYAFAHFDDAVFAGSPEAADLIAHRDGCENCNSC